MMMDDELKQQVRKDLERGQAIIALNRTIQAALKKHLDEINAGLINIRFDIPDKTCLPDNPTVCVFLYDIQEDLELRHAQPRPYRAQTGTFDPRQVNARCCYLVTYWEQPKKEGMGPDSQPMVVMNAVLNALLNAELDTSLRELNLPLFSRVIAPSEHLSSLGNFWQSLGDRPRLCLNFQVTIPIELGLDQTEKTPPVLKPMLDQAMPKSWEDYDKSLPFKRALVDKVLTLLEDVNQVQSARVQLARLAVTCEYTNRNDPPVVHVSGLLDKKTYGVVNRVINENADEWSKIGVQVPVNINGLTEVTASKYAV
ncbi:DUF4255 domain-containing protein [Mycetohabitans rhizoxinica]